MSGNVPFKSMRGFQGFLEVDKGLKQNNGKLFVDNGSGIGFDSNNKLVSKWSDVSATGNVDFNNYKGINAATPTNSEDIANKSYVDGWSSIQAQSDVDMNSNKITNLADPSSAQDSVTRNYLEGGGMTNNLDLNSNKITNLGAPANDQDATSKRYVDSLTGKPPLKDQILAYYTFDGDYKDSTTNNYDGTPNGTVQISNTAIINKSVEFNGGSNDYVDLGSGAFDFSPNDFSVSCWINMKDISSTQVIWTTGVDTDNYIRLIYESGSSSFELGVKQNGNFNGTATNVGVSTGTWTHVIVTRQGSTYRLYQNGTKLIDTTGNTGGITGIFSRLGATGTNTANLDGFIDELGAWERVLSQEEIEHLYNNGNGTQYLSTYDWYAVKQSNHVDMNGYRVLNAKNLQIVADVTHYGAVGGQDSTQAFNDAIADSDYIFIPPTASPFLLNGGDVTIPSNKTIYGVGASSQIQLIAKDYGDTANTPVGALNISGSQNVVLRDFKVDGNKNDGSLTGNSLLNIECINLDNCRQVFMYRLVLDNAKSEGIDFDDCEDCYCIGCQCYNCGGFGIHISINSQDCELSHCVADNCGHDRSRGGFDVYSSASHCRLSHLKVLNCHKGIHLNGPNNMLTNFRVSGSTYEGLLVEGNNNSVSNGRTAVSAQAADTKVIGNQNMLMGIHTNNDINISGDNNSLVASTYDSISDSGNNNDKIANYEN